jgi:hypothetical protein
MKFKMEAMAGLSLTLDLIILGQFGFICPSGFREEAF